MKFVYDIGVVCWVHFQPSLTFYFFSIGMQILIEVEYGCVALHCGLCFTMEPLEKSCAQLSSLLNVTSKASVDFVLIIER